MAGSSQGALALVCSLEAGSPLTGTPPQLSTRKSRNGKRRSSEGQVGVVGLEFQVPLSVHGIYLCCVLAHVLQAIRPSIYYILYTTPLFPLFRV
jgi:hypothetical protein